MSNVIALDLNGHLVEIQGSYETYMDAVKYLHNWYKSYKDLSIYVVFYENGLNEDATGGTKYEFNISKYYVCEDGVYYEETFEELDQGRGLKEIGQVLLVNDDLLPESHKQNNELVEEDINHWIRSPILNPKINPATIKPMWLI